MSKQWKELTFEQLQPLHIGMGHYGVLAPTRLFIPGYTMWGALTAGLGRFRDETEAKLQIDPFTKISNFYPVINDNILFPNFKKGEICLGDYSEKEFRHEFTDTIMSTSILPEHQSAKDQGLHEIEILLPASKKNGVRRLSWRGILKIEKEKQVDDYLNEGLTIIVGGEASYGFGMMKLEKFSTLTKSSEWNLSNDSKRFEITNKKPVVHFSKGFKILKGSQSPWYHVDKKDQNFEAHLKIVWRPGSVSANSDCSNIKLKKGLLSKS